MSFTLPDGKSISMANQLSSTSSVVNGYLRVKLNRILLQQNAVDEYKAITDALDETTRVTQLRAQLLDDISGKTWTGTATPTDLENIKAGTINYLDASAIEGMKHLNARLGANQKVSNISMVYYIDAGSQLNRGYLINGEVVANKDDELVVDQMFHSWLISHNMASNDIGVIYRRLKDGTVTDQLVPPDEVTKLLADPTTGLETTAKKIDPSLEFNMIWAPPDEVAAAEKIIAEQKLDVNPTLESQEAQKAQMAEYRQEHPVGSEVEVPGSQKTKSAG